MEIVALVILLGLSLALIFGLPFGLAQYFYIFLKRKKIPIYWRWIAIIPAVILLYVMSSLILPEEHLYKLDYTEIIGYAPPENASFFYGQADSIGNQKFVYAFGMQTVPERFHNIEALLKTRGFLKDSISPLPDTNQSYIQKNKDGIATRLKLSRYPNFDYYAYFLQDSSTIFMQKIEK